MRSHRLADVVLLRQGSFIGQKAETVSMRGKVG